MFYENKNKVNISCILFCLENFIHEKYMADVWNLFLN